MSSFPKRLKELREELGFKQSDLAEQLGLGSAAVSKYENGVSQPDIESLVKIAAMFRVSADYLLGLSDNPLPNNQKTSFDEDDVSILYMINKLPGNYKYEVKGYINGILSMLETETR